MWGGPFTCWRKSTNTPCLVHPGLPHLAVPVHLAQPAWPGAPQGKRDRALCGHRSLWGATREALRSQVLHAAVGEIRPKCSWVSGSKCGLIPLASSSRGWLQGGSEKVQGGQLLSQTTCSLWSLSLWRPLLWKVPSES